MAYVIVRRLLRLNRLKFVAEFDEPFEELLFIVQCVGYRKVIVFTKNTKRKGALLPVSIRFTE